MIEKYELGRTLQWGLKHAVPEHAPVAWGARAIIKDSVATFDLLPDRQHMVGDNALRKALGRALNSLAGHDGYLAQVQQTYDKLRCERRVSTRTEGVVKLVDDPYLLAIKSGALLDGDYIAGNAMWVEIAGSEWVEVAMRRCE